MKVTGEGRLPRALVRQVQERRPDWYPFEGLATWEENLYALHCLHHLLKGAGLLRVVNGKLGPTKVAAHDREIVRRLRASFEKDDFVYVVAGTLAASVSERGPQSYEDAAAAIHPFCDWR